MYFLHYRSILLNTLLLSARLGGERSTRNQLEKGIRIGTAVAAGAMLPTPSAHVPEQYSVETASPVNIVQRLWDETDLGRHIDAFIPAANPLFVEDVAAELGVDYRDEQGNAKGYSDVIFEWAEQHPELGSAAELSALGGLGIIKTATGYSVLFAENDTHVVYDFDTNDVNQVIGFVLKRIGSNAEMYWSSILRSISEKGDHGMNDNNWDLLI